LGRREISEEEKPLQGKKGEQLFLIKEWQLMKSRR